MAGNRASTHPVPAPKARPPARHEPVRGMPAWLTPGRMLALVVLVGAVVAGVLIGVSVIGSSSSNSSASVTGAAEVQQLLSGVPQQGTVLGYASAPVTLVEYADLQCPYCAQFATGTLPTLVSRYVRRGRMKIEFRGLAFLGSDSVTALHAVVAAGGQGHAWSVLELLYRSQGTENSGWVTDDLLRSVGAATPGLDVQKMMSDRAASTTDAAIVLAQRQAEALMGSQIRTPTFEIGHSGSALEPFDASSLDPGAFTPTIDALLGQ